MSARVLFYISSLGGGGAERVWALIASALSRSGDDVILAVDTEAQENLSYLDPRIPVHVLGKNHIGATMALARLIAREKPDAAFAALGASDLKLLAAARWARKDTRVILSVHGDYSYEERLLGRLRFRMTPWTARMADATIVVSEGLKTDLVSNWGVAAERLTCICNPVYLQDPAKVPNARELAARDNVVLSVSRLVPQKDHATLIRAFAKSKLATRLLIAGDGPLRAELETLTRALGISSRVEFLGYVAQPWDVFGRAKLFAHTSRTEAFGNVIVEALGSGLPVVATTSAGPAEILDHGRWGELVASRDVEDIAAAIDRGLRNPGDPLVRRARAELYGVAGVISRYRALVHGDGATAQPDAKAAA
jgi:glycosyltransferase involved in cell wall biosynthesis